VADIKSERRPASDWNRWPASFWNAWPASSVSAIHTSSIRAVYELYQAWRAQPKAIEQVCSTQDSFTDAQARRIAHELRAPSTSAENASDDIPSAAPATESASPNSPPVAENEHNHTSEHARSPREQRKSKSAVSILVQHGDRAGRLLTDGPANKGTRFASVRFFGTGQTEEVPVSEVRIEEIAPC